VANWSEFGWATVEEYDINKLVSDSNNEKRLFRAKRNVEHTQKKRRQGSTRSVHDNARAHYHTNPPFNHGSTQQLANSLNGAGHLQATGTNNPASNQLATGSRPSFPVLGVHSGDTSRKIAPRWQDCILLILMIIVRLLHALSCLATVYFIVLVWRSGIVI